MKLKYNFAVSEIAGDSVALAVGDDAEKFNGFIRMNSTGAFIFSLLNEEITLEGIVEKMKQEYEGTDEKTLTEAAEGFIEKLKESDVLI